ncbi:hypothetical protein O3M35_002220 [Rhynocoris fuscipes]|uniref:Uncharacterized protein n=1 Tax=Rhynocoris fuscipes TaxID=488301 RepID=A0AAW1CUD3_9HEMI
MADNSDKITETSFTMDISETDTDTEIRQPTETATEITREHPDYVNIVPQPLAEITREHPDYVNIVPQCSAEITEHPDYVNIVPQPSAETDESSDEISADESYALYPDLSPEVTEPTDFMVDETFLELPVHPVYANEIIKNRLGKKSTKSPRDVKPKTPVHPVYANVIIKERGDDMTAEPIPSTSTAEITVEQTPEKDKSVAKKRKIKQKDSPPRVNIISTIPPSLAAKIDRTNVTEYPLYMNIITKYPEVHRSHYPMYVNFIVSRPKIKTEEKDISKEQTDESKEQTDESKEQTVESKEQTVESKEQIVESKEQTDESKVPTYISKEPTYVVESSAKSPETVTSFLEFLFKKGNVREVEASPRFVRGE